MALSLTSVQKAADGLTRIFGCTPELSGRKADGGYDAVSISVKSMDRDQVMQLSALAFNIPNSMKVHSVMGEVVVMFY